MANVNLLYIVALVDVLCENLIEPIFTDYLRNIGFDNLHVGLLTSIYYGSQFFASPIVGHLCDIYSTRVVLVVTFLTLSLSYPLMGSASSFCSIFCARMVIGGARQAQILCKNYIRECVTNEGNHVKYFGKLSGYTSMGYIIGPIIAGYLLDLQNGFLYVSFLCGLLSALNLAFSGKLATPSKAPFESTGRPDSFYVSFKKIPWPRYWDLLMLRFVIAVVNCLFYLDYKSALISRYRVSSVLVGYSFAIQGMVGFLTGFTVQYMVNLFPENLPIREKIQIVYVILMFNFMALYFSANYYTFVGFLVPFSVCLYFISIMNQKELVERIKHCNAGMIIAFFNNINTICRFILPAIYDGIMEKDDYDTVYLVCITTILTGIFIINYADAVRYKKLLGRRYEILN